MLIVIKINPFTTLCMCTACHKMTKSNVIPAVKGLMVPCITHRILFSAH